MHPCAPVALAPTLFIRRCIGRPFSQYLSHLSVLHTVTSSFSKGSHGAPPFCGDILTRLRGCARCCQASQWRGCGVSCHRRSCRSSRSNATSCPRRSPPPRAVPPGTPSSPWWRRSIPGHPPGSPRGSAWRCRSPARWSRGSMSTRRRNDLKASGAQRQAPGGSREHEVCTLRPCRAWLASVSRPCSRWDSCR